MASFNRNKLLRMLERRRAANLQLRDVTERSREARASMLRMRSTIEQQAPGAAAQRLLNMPVAEALKLQRQDIEQFTPVDDPLGREERVLLTGVNAANFYSYLRSREAFERLDAERQSMAERFDAEFSVVAPLMDAVRAWGLSDPELEAY